MKAFILFPVLAASALLISGSGAMAAYGISAHADQAFAPTAATTAPSTGAVPATPPPAPAAPPAKHSMFRSPESIQCSKEADTRGLHGKARVKFRAACKTALRHHQPIPEVKS